MKRYDAILNEGFEQNKKMLCKWAQKEETACRRRDYLSLPE